MAEAVGGDFVEQLRQLLAEPREPVLRVQRARAVRLAFMFIGVDQVDVGTEIEFATAELAQPEHHQPLRIAFTVADHAEALHHLEFERIVGELQAGVGQGGAAGQDPVDRRALHHVAPDQAGRLRVSETPQ